MTETAAKWDCAIGTPEEDHDWVYDAGEPDVGLNGCYVCRACGKVDQTDREPPSDE